MLGRLIVAGLFGSAYSFVGTMISVHEGSAFYAVGSIVFGSLVMPLILWADYKEGP